VINKIEEKIDVRYDKKIKIYIADNISKNMIDRLNKTLFTLIKRGNINLSIGITITTIGLVVLGVIIVNPLTETETWADFIKYFTPRLSLVIFIEILAYFFLKLYKESLVESKYIQNEITNIESKYLAASMAITYNDAASIKNIIDVLSKTERNHILEKGQTTIALEKARIEQVSNDTLISNLSSIINKKS
jgi:uncharacterized membrane protein YjfL (UPF0719 family)